MQYFGFDRPSFGIKTFGFGSSEFSPLDLFAGGTQGVWYDPSDLTTLFRDVAGTVPVPKDGDPVALRFDKSQGVYGDYSASPTVNLLLNGSSSALGTITGANTFTNSGSAAISFPVDGVVSGKNYEVILDWAHSASSATVRVYFSNDIGNPTIPSSSTDGIGTWAETNARGRSVIRAVGNNFTVRVSTGRGTGTINSVRVRELKGNHALQSVSAQRPTYQTDGKKSWLYHDKVDDKMLVVLPAMTATIVTATDDGVMIDYPVNIPSGNYQLTNSSTLGRDYGRLIIDKELSAQEKADLITYFDAKRGA